MRILRHSFELRIFSLMAMIAGISAIWGCQIGSKVHQLESKADWAVQSFNAPVMTQEQFVQLWSEQPPDGILIVDTRSKEEFAVSHIPGAIFWNPYEESALPSQVRDALDREELVVFYCSIGYRSGYAADLVLESRPESRGVYNLKGGIFQWANENRPIYGTPKVHQYDSTWGQYLREELRQPLN